MMASLLLTCVGFFISVRSQLTEPMREAAMKAGIFIGSAANYGDLQEDAQYAEILGEQYDLITAENSCKWKFTEPNYNESTFTQCDYLFNFAQSKNQTFRGHNLCWNKESSNPSWLINGNYNASQKIEILQNHITNVMQHYPNDSVYCWAVVNVCTLLQYLRSKCRCI